MEPTKVTTSEIQSSEFHSLVQRLRDGDANAVAEMWDAFGPGLRRRARSRLRQFGIIGHAESMDICNAVLLDLVRKENIEIQSPSHLMQYVRRAIDNQVRDELKMLMRDKRDIRRNETNSPESLGLHASQSSPSQIMIRQEVFARIVKLLGDDGEQFLTLVLNNESWEDIGKKLGIKSGTARMRWQRATEKIRAKLVHSETT